MSVLDIVAIGPASSVQDRGRFGAQRYGLTPSGAMDVLALATANALAGNTPFAAAVELGPYGAKFKTRDGAAYLALAGAPRPASIEGRALRWPQSFVLADGETLQLGVARNGAFSYLALGGGGVRGEAVFGSRSVNARAGLGSPYPRPLQSGDTLDVGLSDDPSSKTIDLPQHDDPLRVVFGPQDDEFSDEMKAAFVASEWRISQTSDRMGYRLEGPPIRHLHGHNIVSDGTVLGSIQVPGNGAPIVLMPDRGTSGGYPKIATVISADIGRFAQMPPGRSFRFQAVSLVDAQRAARAFAALIEGLPGRVQTLRDGAFDLDALRSANVAGVAVNATDASSW